MRILKNKGRQVDSSLIELDVLIPKKGHDDDDKQLHVRMWSPCVQWDKVMLVDILFGKSCEIKASQAFGAPFSIRDTPTRAKSRRAICQNPIESLYGDTSLSMNVTRLRNHPES